MRCASAILVLTAYFGVATFAQQHPANELRGQITDNSGGVLRGVVTFSPPESRRHLLIAAAAARTAAGPLRRQRGSPNLRACAERS